MSDVKESEIRRQLAHEPSWTTEMKKIYLLVSILDELRALRAELRPGSAEPATEAYATEEYDDDADAE